MNKKQRQKTHGNVDEKYPVPRRVVGNCAAKGWTDRRRNDDCKSIDSKCTSAFFGRKGICKDGLLTRRKATAAKALQHAEENQGSENPGQST